MQLNYFCYLNSTGYSIAAQDYLLALRQSDPELDIRIHPLNKVKNVGVSSNRAQIFAAMEKKKAQAESVNIYHSIPQRYSRPRGARKHIGLCMFETMNPPASWVDLMNNMDEIVTASEFNKRIFEANGVKVPIKKVPHCFDSKMFNQSVAHVGRYSIFTFFAMGTWKLRKNWESLIKGFYDAFEEKDGVCLLIKTDQPVLLKEMVQRVKRTCEWRGKKTAPIYADDSKGHCNFEDIPSIMKKGDVFINASLGEGFGLPGLHAMALGIPILTTKFGGALEYAKSEYVTYIEPKHYKTHFTMDNLPQFRNSIWPVIRITEIRDKLRFMKENYTEVQKKAQLGYDFVHENFNYKTIGDMFIGVIND